MVRSEKILTKRTIQKEKNKEKEEGEDEKSERMRKGEGSKKGRGREQRRRGHMDDRERETISKKNRIYKEKKKMTK